MNSETADCNSRGYSFLALSLFVFWDCSACVGRWKRISKFDSCPLVFYLVKLVCFYCCFFSCAGIVGKGAGVRAGWVAPRNTGGIPFSIIIVFFYRCKEDLKL